jgi:hypothetical protein
MPEPGWYCVPPGLPATMTMTSMVSYPIEIIQTPDRITMIAELVMQLRRIYLDDPRRRRRRSQAHAVWSASVRRGCGDYRTDGAVPLDQAI